MDTFSAYSHARPSWLQHGWHSSPNKELSKACTSLGYSVRIHRTHISFNDLGRLLAYIDVGGNNVRAQTNHVSHHVWKKYAPEFVPMSSPQTCKLPEPLPLPHLGTPIPVPKYPATPSQSTPRTCDNDDKSKDGTSICDGPKDDNFQQDGFDGTSQYDDTSHGKKVYSSPPIVSDEQNGYTWRDHTGMLFRAYTRLGWMPIDDNGNMIHGECHYTCTGVRRLHKQVTSASCASIVTTTALPSGAGVAGASSQTLLSQSQASHEDDVHDTHGICNKTSGSEDRHSGKTIALTSEDGVAGASSQTLLSQTAQFDDFGAKSHMTISSDTPLTVIMANCMDKLLNSQGEKVAQLMRKRLAEGKGITTKHGVVEPSLIHAALRGWQLKQSTADS